MWLANSNTISIALIGAGALVWAFAAKPVVKDKNLKVDLNPFGINRSPFGEVFAIAMQGPVDTYWQRGEEAGQAASIVKNQSLAPEKTSGTSGWSPRTRFMQCIVGMEKAVNARTNPTPASKAYKFNVRRQIENKLKFAYHLDPSNYANYNSYHFFLTEPQLGTHPELTPGAAKLAEDTIHYCLGLSNDPRPALTAASAATNILHLMFNDRQQGKNHFTTAQMSGCLQLLDHCIARHHELAARWNLSGEKLLLSPMRISEMEDRLSFVCKIRDAAEASIQRLEQAPPPHQATN